jgi:hypothetical protein
MLRTSLAKVDAALTDLEKVRGQRSPATLSASPLGQLPGAVNSAVERLREIANTLPADVRGNIKPVLNALESAADEAASAPPGGPSQLLRLNASVANELTVEVTSLSDELDAIEDTTVQAAMAVPDERDRLLAKAWAAYATCYAGCREIFADYVDLVRGVLVRDAGLDADLCLIADQLVGSWPFTGYTWQSLSIPTTHDGAEKSKASLIRLGFPEWSIWSLPLVAREFGHVSVATHPGVNRLIKEAVQQRVASEAKLRSWAADVFATSAMGSAYPWAAMLLRADPGSDDDTTRVAVMLQTVGILGADETVRTQLLDTWEGATGERPELDQQTADFVARIAVKAGAVRFTDWEAADRLTDGLEAQEAALDDIAAGIQVNKLRNVLVAAWHARVRLAVDTTDGDSLAESAEQRSARRADLKEKLDDLAKRVCDICTVVLDSDRKESEGGSRPLIPPAPPDGRGDRPKPTYDKREE